MQPRAGAPWLSLRPVATVDGEVLVNEYFATHPEMIIGELRRVNGQYGADDLDVVADPDKTMAPAVAAIVSRSAEAGRTYEPRTEPTPATSLFVGPLVRSLDQFTVRKEGTIVAIGVATFARVREGKLEPFQAQPKNQTQELRALCGLRDTLAEVLDLQATSTDDAVFRDAQGHLNRRYDDYLARYGPISRFATFETGRTDPDTAEAIIGRRNPRLGGFRTDPDFPSLLALELFDPETQTAAKAAIFSERVVGPREVRGKADSPEEAVTICLDEQGTVTLERVSELLGIEAAEVRGRLGTLVFDDPLTEELVPAGRYLSGNVRVKLRLAEAAAANDARFAPNVVRPPRRHARRPLARRDRRPPRGHLDRSERRVRLRPRDPRGHPGGHRARRGHCHLDHCRADLAEADPGHDVDLGHRSARCGEPADQIAQSDLGHGLRLRRQRGQGLQPRGHPVGPREATGTLRPLRHLDLGGPRALGAPGCPLQRAVQLRRPPRLGRQSPVPARACPPPSYRTPTSSTPPGARCKSRRCCSATRSVPARPPPWSWRAWR